LVLRQRYAVGVKEALAVEEEAAFRNGTTLALNE